MRMVSAERSNTDPSGMSVALLGQYMASSFVMAGDGQGGTLIPIRRRASSSLCWRNRKHNATLPRRAKFEH